MSASALVLKDISRRKAVESTELLRRAYLFVARNTTLPVKTRYRAQLALSNQSIFPANTRPHAVHNRCIETGKGRGVLSKTKLCRFQFKLKAKAGELNGWQKASW